MIGRLKDYFGSKTLRSDGGQSKKTKNCLNRMQEGANLCQGMFVPLTFEGWDCASNFGHFSFNMNWGWASIYFQTTLLQHKITLNILTQATFSYWDSSDENEVKVGGSQIGLKLWFLWHYNAI